MTKTRREFAPEFKREAVALLESGGRPLTLVAVELGIQPSMLRAWRAAIRGPAMRSRPGQHLDAGVAASGPSPADLASQNAKLKRELDRMRMERDVLKNYRGPAIHLRGRNWWCYDPGGGERPLAFWWHLTPLKNVVHGLLRT